MNKKMATPKEMLGIVVLCFGIFILISIESVLAGYRPMEFTDAGLIWIMSAECVFGALALAVLHSRGHVLADLLPVPTWKGCAVGAILYLASALVSVIVILPFMDAGQALQLHMEQFSLEAKVTLPVVVAMAMVNGLYEELFLLSYLVRALKPHGASMALGVSLLVRVLYHLYQGPIGALSVLGFGLVLSVFYWLTGRLWPVVFAHTLADIIPFL